MPRETVAQRDCYPCPERLLSMTVIHAHRDCYPCPQRLSSETVILALRDCHPCPETVILALIDCHPCPETVILALIDCQSLFEQTVILCPIKTTQITLIASHVAKLQTTTKMTVFMGMTRQTVFVGGMTVWA